GRVHLCCRDTEGDHVIADTATEELDAIWNGEHFRRLRRLHGQGRFDEIDACAPCDRVWTGGYMGGNPLRMLRKNIDRLFGN
ncbi:MAG: SPASM domain-containing protein, partial [bacterium]